MTFERKEFDELLEERFETLREQRRPELERDLRVAAASDKLTGTPEWDFYLNETQEIISENRRIVKDCDAVLLGPEVKQEVLLAAKVARAEAMGAIAALERAQAIPKRLIEQGKQSKRVLSA
jgi:hypothetical protein